MFNVARHVLTIGELALTIVVAKMDVQTIVLVNSKAAEQVVAVLANKEKNKMARAK